MAHPFKFKLFSDIHLELGAVTIHKLDQEPYRSLLDPCGADFLVLAGDVGKPRLPLYTELLVLAAARFKRIFIVMGNHEYYNGSSKEEVDVDMRCWLSELNHTFRIAHKVVLLDRNEDDAQVYLPECNLRVLGCTLWSWIPPEAAREAAEGLNDFRMIGTRSKDPTKPRRRCNVEDYNSWHVTDRQWLEDQIYKAQLKGERLVVVTHHAPTRHETSAPQFRGQGGIGHCFSTDLDELLEMTDVLCWCFGHTHFSTDMQWKGTRVVANQVGYFHERREAQQWDARKVISL
ncbi:Metallo-dependent phosphatase-like protein [Chytriomyces sp. MP71]|nr:Metallo-dependent phosphatase-like protein [Chytriomyces sp. MP71]